MDTDETQIFKAEIRQRLKILICEKSVFICGKKQTARHSEYFQNGGRLGLKN
jgi:hypothetical protein